jgi:large subunit ribosomal protein L24
VKPLKFYKSDRATAGQRKAARAAANRPRKMHVTKGDIVLVISGDDKGKRGKVLKAVPDKGKVVIEGINIVKRHRKARQQGEESGIISMPAPIAVSKVMLLDPKSDEPTRVRRRVDKDGTVERVAARSGEPIPRSR